MPAEKPIWHSMGRDLTIEEIGDDHLRNIIFFLREKVDKIDGIAPRDLPIYRLMLREAAKRDLPVGKARGYFSPDEIMELANNDKVSPAAFIQIMSEAFGPPPDWEPDDE